MSVAVSVLVCTYQRAADVVRCLEAVGRVRFPLSDLEVVVVDDGSDEPVEAAIGRLKLPMAVRVIRQSHSGLASARNTGIRAAAGELLVIIDDDTVADARLIEEHCRLHRHHDRLVVMGRVRHVEPGRPPGRWPRLADFSTSFFWTANVSVARHHLLDAGLFDEDFREYGWEDLELGDRLRAMGLSRRRNRRAVVDHMKPPPAAADVPAMLARAEASGRSAVVYVRKRPTARARLATGLTAPRRALSRALGRCESRFSAIVNKAPDGPLRGSARVAAAILAGIHYYRSAEQAMATAPMTAAPRPPD